MIQLRLNHFHYILERLKSEPWTIICLEEQYLLEFSEDHQIFKIPYFFYQKNQQLTMELFKDEVFNESECLILILKSGTAMLARFQNHEYRKHKLIRRYMVRKSQGKSQLKHLKEKGKSRLGSRIRLQQTTKFFEDINDWLEHEITTLGPKAKIFLSCGPTLYGYWWKEHAPKGIDKDDSKWLNLPFHCNDPVMDELFKIYRDLVKFEEQKSPK